MELIITVSLFLTEFNSSILLIKEPQVEGSKASNQYPHNTGQYITCNNKVCYSVIECLRMTHSSTHYPVWWEYNNCCWTWAMEQHVQEKLVVIESNAICYPGAVMIHLEYASITLRAMVTSVGLCFETPLANTYTAKFFLFNWHNSLSNSRSIIFAKLRVFVSIISLEACHRSFNSIKILKIFMLQVLRVLLVVLYHFISKLISFWLSLRQVLGSTFTICLWISVHIPLFFFRYISWICYNCSNNRNQQHWWRERKDNCKNASSVAMSRCFFFWLPLRIKSNMWVVLSDTWIQVEIAVKYSDINIQAKSYRHRDERYQFV